MFMLCLHAALSAYQAVTCCWLLAPETHFSAYKALTLAQDQRTSVGVNVIAQCKCACLNRNQTGANKSLFCYSFSTPFALLRLRQYPAMQQDATCGGHGRGGGARHFSMGILMGHLGRNATHQEWNANPPNGDGELHSCLDSVAELFQPIHDCNEHFVVGD